MDLFPEWMLGTSGGTGGGGGGGGKAGAHGEPKRKPIIKVTAFSEDTEEGEVTIRVTEVRNGVGPL